LSAGEVVFAVLKPSGIVLLLLAAGLLALPLATRFGVVVLASGALLFVVLAALPVGAMALRPLENRFAGTELSEEPDGIVVLGGYIAGAHGSDVRYLPLSEAGERLTAAAELAVRFPDARLVIAGNPVGRERKSSAELSAALLESFGIAPERMVLEDRSRSTWENARHTLQSAAPGEGERYVLVTSAFHMPRAVATFRAAGWPDLVPYPVDHRLSGGPSLPAGPPDAAANLALADLAAREWAAILLYRLTGRTREFLPSSGSMAKGASFVPSAGATRARAVAVLETAARSVRSASPATS